LPRKSKGGMERGPESSRSNWEKRERTKCRKRRDRKTHKVNWGESGKKGQLLCRAYWGKQGENQTPLTVPRQRGVSGGGQREWSHKDWQARVCTFELSPVAGGKNISKGVFTRRAEDRKGASEPGGGLVKNIRRQHAGKKKKKKKKARGNSGKKRFHSTTKKRGKKIISVMHC